jgi:hypothetical protein
MDSVRISRREAQGIKVNCAKEHPHFSETAFHEYSTGITVLVAGNIMSEIKQSPSGNQVFDLRTALEIIRQYENEYIETSEPVDPAAELSGSIATWGQAAQSCALPEPDQRWFSTTLKAMKISGS